MAKQETYKVQSRIDWGENDSDGNTVVKTYEAGDEIKLDPSEAQDLVAAGVLIPATYAKELDQSEKALADADEALSAAQLERNRALNARTAARAEATEKGFSEGRRRGDVGSSKYENDAFGLAADPEADKGTGSGADDLAADQAKGQSKGAKSKEG